MATDIRITSTDTLIDIAFKVCTTFERAGKKIVLCGGSAAEFYVPQDYQSGDVDFILPWLTHMSEIDLIAQSIGYFRKGRIFSNADTFVTLDFPSDELLIWDEHVKDFDTFHRDGLVLYVQTPYDTVRDRLCWFFWDRPDYQAMHVAVAVARKWDVDLVSLKEWAERIGMAERFAEFLSTANQ